jgi:hypothetical protein
MNIRHRCACALVEGVFIRIAGEAADRLEKR